MTMEMTLAQWSDIAKKYLPNNFDISVSFTRSETRIILTDEDECQIDICRDDRTDFGVFVGLINAAREADGLDAIAFSDEETYL